MALKGRGNPEVGMVSMKWAKKEEEEDGCPQADIPVCLSTCITAGSRFRVALKFGGRRRQGRYDVYIDRWVVPKGEGFDVSSCKQLNVVQLKKQLSMKKKKMMMIMVLVVVMVVTEIMYV
jgi:hypothetical protein